MKKLIKWILSIFDNEDYCSHCGYYCTGKSYFCNKNQPNANIKNT